MAVPVPRTARTALTEHVDARAGSIRAVGVLTRTGADLLCGTVETLERQGHRRITLDLSGLRDADDEGLGQVEELRLDLAARSRRLTVHAPDQEGR
jgi:hypothetical protein